MQRFHKLERTRIFFAAPGVISVSLRVCQTDNIVPPSPLIVVPSPVIVVPIVVVIVIRSIYVCSTLVWIDTSSALRENFIGWKNIPSHWWCCALFVHLPTLRLLNGGCVSDSAIVCISDLMHTRFFYQTGSRVVLLLWWCLVHW